MERSPLRKLKEFQHNGWKIEIFRNEYPSHPFEWKISQEIDGKIATLFDPTSRTYIQDAEEEARRVVDYYAQNPRDLPAALSRHAINGTPTPTRTRMKR